MQTLDDVKGVSDASRRPLVIAIDFGTSYSGYAYQFIDEYETHPTKISTPQPFNGGKHNLASLKTPTCILINDKLEVDSFGFEAEDRYEDLCLEGAHDKFYLFKQFKMKLQDIEGLQPSFPLQDETGTKSLPANVVFSQAIKSLKNHALGTVRKERTEIKEDKIMWVLTVPAIWDEKAIEFMKDAAVLAGIEKKNLMIASEPEAAAFACKYYPLTTISEDTQGKCFSDMDPGSYYMVVDLGGGTADIVIHKKLAGSKVKAVSRPSGGPWGGTAVDSEFIQFLIKIVGARVFKKFQEECPIDYMDFVREFEAKKRTFHQDAKTKVYLRISGDLSRICKEESGKDFKEAIQETSYASKVKFVGDKAVFDPDIFAGFFSAASNQIINHIKDLIASCEGSKVSVILLVGGFTQSPYIQNAIKKHFQGQKKHVLIPKEPEISVLKGAIIFARQSNLKVPRLIAGIIVATFRIGIDVSSGAYQFRSDFLKDPRRMYISITSEDKATKPSCILLRSREHIYDTGTRAQEEFSSLFSDGYGDECHFFQNIYPTQFGQETVEDHRGISMKAVDVLSMYITHEWRYMWDRFDCMGIGLRKNDVTTVITVPATYSQNAENIITSLAEMVGIEENTVYVVSESEAIYKYIRIGRPNMYQDFSSLPSGSRICIANFEDSITTLSFHGIQGQNLGVPYETVSGSWGSKSIAEGFLETLAEVVGKNVVDRFKEEEYEYEPFMSNMLRIIRRYNSRNDAQERITIRSDFLIMECKKTHSKTLQEMLENSPYYSQILVKRDRVIIITGHLLDRYFWRTTSNITEQVKKNLVERGEGVKTFMILTGEFAEEISNDLMLQLSRLGVQTAVVSSDENPVHVGAIMLGWGL